MDQDERLVDLHTHSTFSDGVLSPEELVEEAMFKGVSALALTDHDEVGGIERAIARGAEKRIEVVPGVELTCYVGDVEVHVLGLFLDAYGGEFRKKLAPFAECRKERTFKIIDKLALQGVKLDPEEVFQIAGEGIVGRMHIARAMVRRKCVESIAEAFTRYIGNDAPCCVEKLEMSPEETVALVRSAGGLAFLAHPGLAKGDETVSALLDAGIDGIEVYHSRHTTHDTEKWAALARERNILVAGGSDYHGASDFEQIGWPVVKYGILRHIKEEKERRRSAAGVAGK